MKLLVSVRQYNYLLYNVLASCTNASVVWCVVVLVGVFVCIYLYVCLCECDCLLVCMFVCELVCVGACMLQICNFLNPEPEMHKIQSIFSCTYNAFKKQF